MYALPRFQAVPWSLPSGDGYDPGGPNGVDTDNVLNVDLSTLGTDTIEILTDGDGTSLLEYHQIHIQMAQMQKYFHIGC